MNMIGNDFTASQNKVYFVKRLLKYSQFSFGDVGEKSRRRAEQQPPLQRLRQMCCAWESLSVLRVLIFQEEVARDFLQTVHFLHQRGGIPNNDVDDSLQAAHRNRRQTPSNLSVVLSKKC
ncbi:Very long-chain specific acyl-CoA dehydrogenase, mitochondrial [Frankliniella fusca]|uniref:Very long-chain specific acyl-CoA dehydrogenase, mitochondrial n=1 Tax=Frankliniella fusca TaxID=407009 RepID=A0AAE1GTB5_9NEOP|nr:Very long-chain specific acyl-CoA dehydrogenase, mitochondrial [Frankliniella fusca]